MDSSAFAKLFVYEPDSESLVRHYESISPRQGAISALAALEVRSAIRRRHRGGDLSTAHANSAATALGAEMLRVTVLPLTPEVAEEAARLIDRHLLRSLDAVQLATAVIFRKSLPEFSELKFISSDEELLLAATAEGLSVWQPHL